MLGIKILRVYFVIHLCFCVCRTYNKKCYIENIRNMHRKWQMVISTITNVYETKVLLHEQMPVDFCLLGRFGLTPRNAYFWNVCGLYFVIARGLWYLTLVLVLYGPQCNTFIGWTINSVGVAVVFWSYIENVEMFKTTLLIQSHVWIWCENALNVLYEHIDVMTCTLERNGHHGWWNIHVCSCSSFLIIYLCAISMHCTALENFIVMFAA